MLALVPREKVIFDEGTTARYIIRGMVSVERRYDCGTAANDIILACNIDPPQRSMFKYPLYGLQR